jgi:hypothetical protein
MKFADDEFHSEPRWGEIHKFILRKLRAYSAADSEIVLLKLRVSEDVQKVTSLLSTRIEFSETITLPTI